nr:hypothetical protein [Tanacetum cinerariifolium]
PEFAAPELAAPELAILEFANSQFLIISAPELVVSQNSQLQNSQFSKLAAPKLAVLRIRSSEELTGLVGLQGSAD